MTGKNNGHLTRFVRTECANYDSHRKLCIDGKPCKVLAGQPCRHFERAVLGAPEHPYKLPGYDYRKLFEQYGRINPKLAGRGVVIRRCECGATLQPRERVCEKCRARKRRETYRESKRKLRNGRVSTVNENRPQNIAV